MGTVGLILILIFFIKLIHEKVSLDKARKKIDTVIHVNGIRGKSTVSRLIDAGLRDGNKQILTKVTGTEPKYIDIDGIERAIKRRGKANIREQIKAVKKAGELGVDILILECMAVKPELQKISEEKIVKSDIGVITNVRYDHLDEMGDTLEKIANSLCNTIPKNGIVITAEVGQLKVIEREAQLKKTNVLLADTFKKEYSDIDFKENVAIALEVCKCLGVEEEIAFSRMKQYKRDSGVLNELKFINLKGKTINFVNLLAANDPDSSWKIIKEYETREIWNRKKYLLVNNRRDRLSRLEQYIDFVKNHEKIFEKIFISGENSEIFLRKTESIKDVNSEVKSEILKGLEQIDSLTEDSLIFAVGNICGKGKLLIKEIESRSI